MPIKKSITLIVLIVLCLISSIFATLLFHKYLKKIDSVRAATLTQALYTAEESSMQINRFIETLETETKKLFSVIHATSDSSFINQELRKKPLFITGFVFVERNKTNNQITGSYFVEKNGRQQLISISHAIDAKAQTFVETLQKGLDTYAGPFVDPYTDEKIIVYTKAHETADKLVIIGATQSLSHLQHVLSTLYMGRQEYWFIADGKGEIILHPHTIFTERPTFLHDFAKLTNSSELTGLITNTKGTIIYNNEMTQQPSWLIHQKIPHTGWTLCGVFEQLQAQIPNNENRHYLMIISLSMLLSFLLVMFTITLLFTTARSHQWMLAILASCACIITIGALWYISKKYPTFDYDTHHTITPIENKVALYTFLDSLKNTKMNDSEEPSMDNKKIDYYLAYRYKIGRYIPTGVFIHYMHFISESQVQIVGYVWQRYFEGTHDGVARGFVLPQATSNATITEVFHTNIERQETIIWRINATLNQEFSYTRYPFDTREITIQLWHADFGNNIMLVPDLDSYPLLTATSLPGLSANAYIPNWQFKNSYFGYQKYLYNSLFGLYTYGPFGIYNLFNKSYTPELHFVAKTQRLLTDTLIDDLLPLFLIALLLFVVFITDIGHGYQVFAAYASIFFGIVVAQLHFRSKTPSNQLVYFENIYVIMYFALIITLMFTFLKLQNPDTDSPGFKQGKMAELFYWPLLLSAIIMVTIMYLY